MFMMHEKAVWGSGKIGGAVLSASTGKIFGGRVQVSDNPVKCDCGKLIARERDGVLYVWCKRCGKEVAIKKELPINAAERADG